MHHMSPSKLPAGIAGHYHQPTTLDSFTIIKKLGEGTYSTVYQVLRRDDNCEYALKKVKMYGLTDKERENAVNEVRILASIKGNKNVIQYKEAFIDA